MRIPDGDCNEFLLFVAAKLLRPNGLTPALAARLAASSSDISLGSLSNVFTPIIPWFINVWSKNLISWTNPDKSVENVKSVEATIFSFESKAIALLLIVDKSVEPIGFSSWIFKVYPKYNSWKLPNTSSGSAILSFSINSLSAASKRGLWEFLNLLKV